MSVRTVKAHIQSMRDKTGFRNRTELAVRAIESGLVMSQPKEEE
jgi:DNA-binding NarL/FixJ family response regulator